VIAGILCFGLLFTVASFLMLAVLTWLDCRYMDRMQRERKAAYNARYLGRRCL